MFSKILRKISKLILILFTFKNWLQVLGYIYFIYLLPGSKSRTGIVNLRNGLKLKIRLSSDSYDLGSIIEIYQRKVYIPSFLNVLDNGVIIDIGASIGDFSIFAASSFNNNIISYEYDHDSFELLKENINLNNFKNRIKAFPLAVSNKGGKIFIGNKLYNSVSIKDVFKKNNINKCSLLKMDIEGMEYDIILNIPKKNFQLINAIVMECHINGNKIENLRKLKDYLTKSGYRVKTTKITVYNVCYLYAKKYQRI